MDKKKPIDILQGKFHYFRGDVELDDENEDLTDRDWEKMMDKNKKHSFMKIMKDLVDSLRNHKINMKQISNDYYEYDRSRFMSMYYDMNRDLETYHTDIETLSTLIIQLHQFGHIIHIDDDGKDIRTHKVIEEKKLTNKHIKELKNGLHKVS